MRADPFASISVAAVCLECLAGPLEPTCGLDSLTYACPCGNTWTTSCRRLFASIEGEEPT